MLNQLIELCTVYLVGPVTTTLVLAIVTDIVTYQAICGAVPKNLIVKVPGPDFAS